MYCKYLLYFADSLLQTILRTRWACKLIIYLRAQLHWLISYCYQTHNRGQNLCHWCVLHISHRYYLKKVSYFTKIYHSVSLQDPSLRVSHTSEVCTSLCVTDNVNFANMILELASVVQNRHCSLRKSVTALRKVRYRFNDRSIVFRIHCVFQNIQLRIFKHSLYEP